MLRATAILIPLLLISTAARGALIEFDIYRNINTIPTNGIDVTVTASENATQFAFTFHNNSTVTSSLNVAYFESGLSAYLNFASAASTQTAGSSFNPTAILKDPPGPTLINWAGSGGSYRSDGPTDPDQIANGLNAPGESFTLTFNKIPGATLNNLLADIATTGRIAVHLRDLNGDDSPIDMVSLPVTIPEPTTTVLALLCVTMLLRRPRPV